MIQAVGNIMFLVCGFLLIGIGFGDWYLAGGMALLAIYSREDV